MANPDIIRRHVHQHTFINDKDELHPSDQSEVKVSVKQSPYCIQNFICLFIAVAVFYFADIINVVLYDTNIKSAWFWAGILSFGVFVGIAIYIIFYQSYWKKLHSDDWEKRFPMIFPVATSCFIFGSLCLTVSLWPVWGFLTPVILLALFLGAVVIIAMMG